MLIPAKDKNGIRPPGVPPTLLQGQVDLALSARDSRRSRSRGPISTRIAPGESRSTPCSARTGDIVTLSVSAPQSRAGLGVLDRYVTRICGRSHSNRCSTRPSRRADGDHAVRSTCSPASSPTSKGNLPPPGAPAAGPGSGRGSPAAPEGTPNSTHPAPLPAQCHPQRDPAAAERLRDADHPRRRSR